MYAFEVEQTHGRVVPLDEANLAPGQRLYVSEHPGDKFQCAGRAIFNHLSALDDAPTAMFHQFRREQLEIDTQ